MSAINKKSTLRREQDILDRVDNVRRLIQMKYTLLTAEGAETWRRYNMTDRDGKRIGGSLDDLWHRLDDEIQLQLLSIVALCYGDNPDLGEPVPMLEWKNEDRFRDTWDECLNWNA